MRIFFQDFISLAVLLAIPLVGIAARRLNLKFLLDPIAISLILIFLVAGILSMRARTLGKKQAWRDMVAATTTLPRVQIGLDPGEIDKNIFDQSEFSEPHHVVLMQAADRTWVFKPLLDLKVSGGIAVVVLPKDAVTGLRMQLATPPRQGDN